MSFAQKGAQADAPNREQGLTDPGAAWRGRVLASRGLGPEELEPLEILVPDRAVGDLAGGHGVAADVRRREPGLDEIKIGETTVDFRKLRAFTRSKEIVMTDREFEVLRHLAERAGSVVTREELLRLVWGYSDTPMTRTVDNFIFRLRHKLEPDPHHPKYIRTAHGDGYRLTLTDQA